MQLKRKSNNRMLRVEQLEKREMLAGDVGFCGPLLAGEQLQCDDPAMVQTQDQVRDGTCDGTADCDPLRTRDRLRDVGDDAAITPQWMQERDRSQEDCDTSDGDRDRLRDRDSQVVDTSAEILVVSQEEAVMAEQRDRTQEDCDTGDSVQQRLRDRDSENRTVEGRAARTLRGEGAVSADAETVVVESTNDRTVVRRKDQKPTTAELTEQEIIDMVFIREEEKLARDVYITLGAEWGVTVFDNIAAAEQQHMDAIGNLLDKYGIEDPIVDNTVGVFTDVALQALYTDLIDDGLVSALDGLKVGAFIEEYDILDIQHAMENTDKSDIDNVYGNLLSGSENHLRAFVSQIELTEPYSPVLLSDAVFQEIIDGSQTTGNGGGGGQNGGGQNGGGR